MVHAEPEGSLLCWLTPGPAGLGWPLPESLAGAVGGCRGVELQFLLPWVSVATTQCGS